MLTEIFEKILCMSLIGSYSILVVCLFRLLLKRLERKYSYWLWFVVFLNLCLPISIYAPFSLIPKQLAQFTVGGGVSESGAEPENRGQEVSETPPEEGTYFVGQEIDPISQKQDAMEKNILRQNTETLSEVQKVESSTGTTAVVEVKQEADHGQTVRTKRMAVCGLVWFVGLWLLLVWNGLSTWKLHRKLTAASCVRYDAEKNIRQLQDIASPFLWGIYKATIYLPTDMEEDEKDYIIAHESYHRRRKDNIVKPVVFGVVILHWFNPLVWLAYALFIRDMEFSCDEAVLAGAEDNTRKQYAASLLKYAAKQSGYVFTPLTFGEPSIKSRISNVLREKKNSVVATLVAALAVAIVMCGLLVRQETVSDETVSDEAFMADKGQQPKEENIPDFIWNFGMLSAQYGRNEYVDFLLGSSSVYVRDEEVLQYLTFAEDNSEIAYVLAGIETENSICGSLWRISVKTDPGIALVKQQITMDKADAQYLDMGEKIYLVLNYEENDRKNGKIVAFSSTGDELLPKVAGEKKILPNGTIQCMADSYVSCRKENTSPEDGQYTWMQGEGLPHLFYYGNDSRVREASARLLSAEELQETYYGENVLEQVEAVHPEGIRQYILRENGELNVNICVEEQSEVMLYYMTFQVAENEKNALLQKKGEGVYLTYMTGEASLKALVQDFGGENHILPKDTSVLPWGEEAAFTKEWQNNEFRQQGQSYVYGEEYAPTEEEWQILSGMLLDCSAAWQDRPGISENFTNGQWNEANKQIFVVQKTEGFVVYGTHMEARMLIQTPEEKFVLVDKYFTSNYGVQPMLLEQDFDGDGSNELAVIGLTEHGTGVCVDYLYMIDKASDGTWYCYRIMHEWYEAELMAHIESRYTQAGLELIFDGVPQGYLMDVQGDEHSRYYAGSQISFSFEEGRILCKAKLMIYSDTQFVGLSDGSELYMELAYLGDGEWFEVACEVGVDEMIREQL